jgi:hypothetical protein
MFMVTSYTLYEGRRFFLTRFRVAIALRGILQTIICLGVSRCEPGFINSLHFLLPRNSSQFSRFAHSRVGICSTIRYYQGKFEASLRRYEIDYRLVRYFPHESCRSDIIPLKRRESVANFIFFEWSDACKNRL